ncbi:PorP/SprF family type IX secretion system membrane protein [Mucilaginibacter ginsenosidivorax]|uniref:Type IX secretion system membrane protein PorP/SprF n=1 Tax=Mucilaginibacter ginsenosidivorax TaxID=862126 RepID=A0A5B8W9M4_9SPHI|nr:PorP/SprF family type IX secretion system membrane protein [Mucilaginibacter ginsenosidivorax]QEC79665.1 type IX secretion system membrane protein PorP/SprF [Mucilaginibacter ginsenosidivorax]
MFIKKNILKLCMVLAFITYGKAFAQQQIYNYSQYADNLTAVNPAYSILDKAGSVSVLGRKQFIGIDGAPSSLMLNAIFPIESINGAAGVYVLNDQAAVEKQIEANVFFAKGVQLTQTDYLAVALNLGVRNYVGNYSQLDATDPQFMNDVRETKPNIGFGVMLYSTNYYLGLSVPELTIRSLGTASQQQANYLRTHYYFTGAYLADVSDDVKVKPATLVSYVNGSPVLANISGTLYLKEQLGIGLNYRTDKKAAAMLSVIGKAFRVGYSYQFGTSSNNLGGVNITTHEVSISYRFGNVTGNKLL